MVRRVVIMVTVAALSLVLMSGQAFAEDLWEKLFGCEGVAPISCPGPVPW